MTRRVRSRATFTALSHARRLRRGGLSLRVVATDEHGAARVAVAVPRGAGTAVIRNRVRRRLRAAIAANEPRLQPGRAYLFGAGRDVPTMPFEQLAADVACLLDEAGEPS